MPPSQELQSVRGELGAPWPYDELRRLASAFLRGERRAHTLQATALLHEAWLRIGDLPGDAIADRKGFCALVAQAIRRVLVDHARARAAKKRGGLATRITLSEEVAVSREREVDLLELDEALAELARLDARQAQVVELRFFCGLSVREVAGILGTSERTVEGDWHMARGFLRRKLAPKLASKPDRRLDP